MTEALRAERPALDGHFEDLTQQHEASSVGMWAFLASEVMFFGGVFAAYLVYRTRYPEAFQAASNLLDWRLGTLNTVVLIGSSLTMALAVRCAQLGAGGRCARWLVATIGLAVAFLVVKFLEYEHKFHEGLVPGPDFRWTGPREGAEIFFSLYFAATGAHALHMLVGLVVLGCVAWRARRGRYTRENWFGVEVTGLYWHFVDLVWIFLFPLLYLLGRHAS